MAAGMNTAANISTYIQNIYEDAMFIARENSLMPMLITNFSDTTDENRLRKSSIYGSATLATIGETDDLSSQTFTPAVLSTLTPAEVGAQFFLTDSRLSSDPFGVRNDAAMELGMAMATKINQDCLGDLASLTGGTVGAAGTAITWGQFFAARALLKAQKAPEPYTAVMHEYQWFVLAKAVAPAATVTNAPALQNEVAGRYYVGTVAGVNVYTTADITIDGSTDAKGGMFSAAALALDSRRAPRLEVERDASRRGYELNMTGVYAHGVWRPAFGVLMYFDAATPSS
jgi:hypothetical protein